MKAEDTKTNKPPYLSWVTLVNFLKPFKDSGIPSQIDKSLMPAFSGATQSSILSAMAFFGLTDDKGKTTPTLKELVETGVVGMDSKPVWKKLFNYSYGPVLGDLDLSTSTPTQLLEKFRVFDYNGDTLRKCHLFFLALSEAADVSLATHLKLVGRPTAVRKSPKKDRSSNSDGNNEEGSNNDDSPTDALPEREGHSIAQIALNAEGDRIVKLQAPLTVTAAELKRIQAWLSFQLIVEDAE